MALEILLSALFSCPEMVGVVDGEQFVTMILSGFLFIAASTILDFFTIRTIYYQGQAKKEPDYVLCR